MANTNKRADVNANSAVEIDPSTPGTIVRVALAAESLLNVLVLGIPTIFNPKRTLEQTYLPAGRSATPEAASALQLNGVGLMAITLPMVLAISNKPGAIELRRTSYQILSVYEAIAIPMHLWQAWVGEEGTGWSPDKLTWGMSVPMGLFLGFRIWVLYAKPQWMGKYRLKKVD